MNSHEPALEYTFQRLCDEKPKLLGYIKKRINDNGDIEDIYQEAITRTTKQLRSGNTLTDPVGYLYRTTSNIINDIYRGQRKGDVSEPLSEDLLCHRPLPDEHVEAQQRLALFIECLNSLPAVTRKIVIMRKLHAKSYSEIANELNMTPKAVEKQLNRILRTLEDMMEKHKHTAYIRSEKKSHA
ncbi:RNA polymerase sigma factor [Cellvibrio sp. PSBB006]|uniref:RNA polymerase sigma factor n=1 Tax=Cellvibrio sp. PSBB006 TaxID=1987723 RepID=UPI0012F95281|nr:sigma-70 family RNA polymerase sigma factor [Cellvibrio sp. PSBB006]